MRNAATNFLKGIFVGIANVIPGVSGGTIMVVLDIFDGIIEAVNNFYKSFALFKKYFLYLLPIVLGACAGILAFGSLINSALANYSFPTVLFFSGLVVGSMPLIYKKATEKDYSKKYLIATLISALFVVLLSLASGGSESAETGVITTGLMVKMFFGGAVAAAAMVVPGISGSFIMLLLGLYYDVINAISKVSDYLANPSDFNMLADIAKVMVPLLIGIVLGILLISKLISILLDKFSSVTYCAIFGLVIGSLFGLFNDPITYQSGINVISVIAGVATFALGFIVALLLGGK